MLNKKLFDISAKRLELLDYDEKNNLKNIKIAVYRNHSFETIASVLNAFLNFSNLKASFDYSSYDDSLTFDYKSADLSIIWVDLSKYNNINLEDFLLERAATLRKVAAGPILVICVGEYNLSILTDKITDCYFISADSILEDMGKSAYDLAKETFSGTKLSNKACLELARTIGLCYIPALFKQGIKAIVTDLDNTIYNGILGEDGIDNLTPNLELQNILLGLKKRGIFLAISSKNEEQDVLNMFQKRKDFPLQLSDFSTYQINWQSKADGISAIAKSLNIGCESILFIDDNPAEIENVSETGVKTLLVDKDICQILKYYPGLLKLKKSEEDTIRTLDIQANKERMKLAETMTTEEYFNKLKIKLTYSIDNTAQVIRISELLRKTNQFILNYVRYNETQVKSIIDNPNSCIVTIRMSDILSDSGIIAILLSHKDNNCLVVDELTVSCRALGRHLENVMLPYMFILAKKKLNIDGNVLINYQAGDRNAPALNWLKEFTNSSSLAVNGCLEVSVADNINLSGLIVEVNNG